jgi:hypothetical protein
VKTNLRYAGTGEGILSNLILFSFSQKLRSAALLTHTSSISVLPGTLLTRWMQNAVPDLHFFFSLRAFFSQEIMLFISTLINKCNSIIHYSGLGCSKKNPTTL